MSDDSDVLAANEAFYDAFARRDVEAMDQLWAKKLPVACVHPGWAVLRGRARVVASWRGILGGPNPPAIRFAQPAAHVLGESAFVVCYEIIPGARLVATNYFVREEGAWRMVHHQASPLARMEEEEDDDVPPKPDRGALN
jgi:hypothetical protein